MKTLEYVRPGGGFKPSFTLFEKSHVNGVDRIPLYQWALNLCDAPVKEFFDKGAYFHNMFTSNDVRLVCFDHIQIIIKENIYYRIGNYNLK